MKESWTRGLDLEVAKDIRGDFKSSLLVRNRLRDLLEAKIVEEHKVLLSKENYESPAWAYKMADNVGFERALNYVISLIVE